MIYNYNYLKFKAMLAVVLNSTLLPSTQHLISFGRYYNISILVLNVQVFCTHNYIVIRLLNIPSD